VSLFCTFAAANPEDKGYGDGQCPLWVNSGRDDRDRAASYVRFTPESGQTGRCHHAQAPAVLDYSRALAQGDGRTEESHSPKNENPGESTSGPSILVVVTCNFLHEHHDPAPQGRIINSHERSDQP
jgi:hypothetical protein